MGRKNAKAIVALASAPHTAEVNQAPAPATRRMQPVASTTGPEANADTDYLQTLTTLAQFVGVEQACTVGTPELHALVVEPADNSTQEGGGDIDWTGRET